MAFHDVHRLIWKDQHDWMYSYKEYNFPLFLIIIDNDRDKEK